MGEEHWAGCSAVVGQPGREVREAGKGEHDEPERSALQDQQGQKRRVHGQEMSGDAGQEVVGVEIDQQRDDEEHHPARVAEQGPNGLGEGRGHPAIIERAPEAEQAAVPDEKIPGGGLGFDVFPQQDAGE